METTETGIVTKTPTPPATVPPALATKPAAQPDAAPKSGKPKGINPKGVFAKLMRDYDPNKVQVLDLQFGTRKVGERDQTVSVLDTGTGKIDVYPVVSRFEPKTGHTIRCFVFFRTKDMLVKGHKTKKTAGFAIPVNLREAQRTNEWLGLRNNILTVTFRRNKENNGYYGFGPNGKVVVVPDGTGFEPPTDKETSVMVSETFNCYIAHCEAEYLGGQETEEKGQALVQQAEMVGAILDDVDTYCFTVAGRLFDACEILGVPSTAREKDIKAAYHRLATTDHPDKRMQEFRKLTGSEPSGGDKVQFNYEWLLIEKAHERLELQHVRQTARSKYMKKGVEAQADMPALLSVSTLAKKLGKRIEIVKTALKHIGYDGVIGRTSMGRDIACTVVGCIASGTIDDLSAPADQSRVITPGGLEVADIKGFETKFADKVANGK